MKLSIKQVVASVAGATIAALALSFLGVGGTLLGVIVGSAAATIFSALAFHSLERGHAKVREIVGPAGQSSTAGDQLMSEMVSGRQIEPPPLAPEVSPWSSLGPAISTTAPSVGAAKQGRGRWPILAVMLLVLGLTMGIVTALELALGQPISTVLSGSTPPAAKTSVGDVLRGGATTTLPTTSTSLVSTTTGPTTTTSQSSTTTTHPAPSTTSTSSSTTTSSTTTSTTTPS